MGALIFYTGIYFLGYYTAHLLNQAVGRALIANRRIAGLVLVLTVSMAHAYKIMTSSRLMITGMGRIRARFIRDPAGHSHRDCGVLFQPDE